MSKMKDKLGDVPFVPKSARDITRRDDPECSFEAADVVLKSLKEIQTYVYLVLYEAGPEGLCDYDLDEICVARYGKRGYSTYRSRRQELVEDYKLVVDSGRKVVRDGTNRTVWVLKRFVTEAA